MDNKTEKQIIKIRNNNFCVPVHNCNDLVKFIYIQVQTYKKILCLFDLFLELLNKLEDKIFNNIDNNENTLKVIKNAIYVLYNNIVMLFTVRINNIQLVNISLSNMTVQGFKIYNVTSTMPECDVRNNLYYYINSLRVQYYKKGLIKIVCNNTRDIPENIMFIGLHNISENLRDTITQCKETVVTSISKIKILQLNYIQILNNLQNIIVK